MLRDKISEILYNDWNPIDVKGLPRDEYDSYVDPLISFIMRFDVFHNTISAHLIANFLREIEAVNMFLSECSASATIAAFKIIDALKVEFKVGETVVIHVFRDVNLKKLHGKSAIVLSEGTLTPPHGCFAKVICGEEIFTLYDDECIPA